MRNMLLFACLVLASCAPKITQTGRATYYASRFEGRRTASGQTYRASRHTAAHRTLPFGTRLKVTNLANGRKVKVVVNDRGPYAAGNMLDLSRSAARQIGMLQSGTARVKIRYRKKR